MDSNLLGTTLYLMKLSIKKQFAYPLMFISCLFLIPMMVASGVLLLYALATHFSSVSGWTFDQLALLYGFGYLSHGLLMVFGAQNIWMDQLVIKGEFDRMLLRPLPVIIQYACSNINLIGFIDVIIGAGILTASSWRLKLSWNAGLVLLLLLTLAGATWIRLALYLIVCSTAFWTKRSSSLFWLMTDLMERATQLPLSIYPQRFQLVLTVLLPLAMISYQPVKQLLNQPGTWLAGLVFLATPVIGLIILYLAVKFFNFGLKQYESAGS